MFLLVLFCSIVTAVSVVMAKGHDVATAKTKASPVAVVPQTNPSSQYHAQDESGQYSYGYTNADGQSKVEVKGIDGSIAGKYSYIDANGKRVLVSYVADHGGFRAVGDHLPSNEVPKVPPHLAQAYLEANNRLNDAYAHSKDKEAVTVKEKQVKKDEEEEEKGEDDEKGGSSGEDVEDEKDKKEKEKDPGKDGTVKVSSVTKPSLASPASVSSPVSSGAAPVKPQQAKLSPQFVYLAMSPYSRIAPASAASPVAIRGATIRLIQAAPIRATEYAFHTYVPTTHHRQQQSTQKSVQVSQTRYVPQMTLAPGFGYVPVKYSIYKT